MIPYLDLRLPERVWFPVVFDGVNLNVVPLFNWESWLALVLGSLEDAGFGNPGRTGVVLAQTAIPKFESTKMALNTIIAIIRNSLDFLINPWFCLLRQTLADLADILNFQIIPCRSVRYFRSVWLFLWNKIRMRKGVRKILYWSIWHTIPLTLFASCILFTEAG